MMQDQTDLSERIANAEDWLARARRQLEHGDRTRTALTLLLAEAEVHHARELGLPSMLGRRRWSWVHGAIGSLAVAALIAGVWVSMPLPGVSVPPAGAPRPTVVALSEGTGSLLHLVQAPPAIVEARPAGDAGVGMRPSHFVVRSAEPPRPVVVAAPGVTVAPLVVKPQAPAPVVVLPAAPAVPPAPAPAPVVVQLPPAPTVLSEADLIDLVLAAERSLRRSNQ